MSTTKLFNSTDKNAAFNPTGAFPLDGRTYFTSWAEAASAAASAKEVGSKESQYYFGQTLAVVENGTASYYIIQPDGTLSAIAASELQISVTYQQLKELRDSGKLIAGQLYRITDYECGTLRPNTKAAHNKFDIIVRALSANTLSEDAKADFHYENGERDPYFCNTWFTINEETFSEGYVVSACPNAQGVHFEGDSVYNTFYNQGCEYEIYYTPASNSKYGPFIPHLKVHDMFMINDQNYYGDYVLKDVFESGGIQYNYWCDSSAGLSLTTSAYVSIKQQTWNNLESWELKYCLDNDTSRFNWAKDTDSELAYIYDTLGCNGCGSGLACYEVVGAAELGLNKFSLVWSEQNGASFPDFIYFNKTETGWVKTAFADAYYAILGTVYSNLSVKSWPESSGGKGVIYWMKDENNNSAPYDFKNILQWCDIRSTNYIVPHVLYPVSMRNQVNLEYWNENEDNICATPIEAAPPASLSTGFYYTFALFNYKAYGWGAPNWNCELDCSNITQLGCQDNNILGFNQLINVVTDADSSYYYVSADGTPQLTANVDYLTKLKTTSYNDFPSDWPDVNVVTYPAIRTCKNITIGKNSTDNLIICGKNITIGQDCHNNFFGEDCTDCQLGNACSLNIFNSLELTSPNDVMTQKAFIYGLNNIKLGHNCEANYFLGTYANISFGNNCSNNIFGAGSISAENGNKQWKLTTESYIRYNYWSNHESLVGISGNNITFHNNCTTNYLIGNYSSYYYGYEYIIFEAFCSENELSPRLKYIHLGSYCTNCRIVAYATSNENIQLGNVNKNITIRSCSGNILIGSYCSDLSIEQTGYNNLKVEDYVKNSNLIFNNTDNGVQNYIVKTGFSNVDYTNSSEDNAIVVTLEPSSGTTRLI